MGITTGFRYPELHRPSSPAPKRSIDAVVALIPLVNARSPIRFHDPLATM
jgi:hypothetical protein